MLPVLLCRPVKLKLPDLADLLQLPGHCLFLRPGKLPLSSEECNAKHLPQGTTSMTLQNAL